LLAQSLEPEAACPVGAAKWLTLSLPHSFYELLLASHHNL